MLAAHRHTHPVRILYAGNTHTHYVANDHELAVLVDNLYAEYGKKHVAVLPAM